jgi:hypothetical protein
LNYKYTFGYDGLSFTNKVSGNLTFFLGNYTYNSVPTTGFFSSSGFDLRSWNLSLATNGSGDNKLAMDNAGNLSIKTPSFYLNSPNLLIEQNGNINTQGRVIVNGGQLELDSKNGTARALMSWYYDANKTTEKRALIINTRNGGETTFYDRKNDFALGTYINSRLFVSSSRPSWWEPYYYHNNILAQFDGHVGMLGLYVDGLIQAEAIKVRMRDDWTWADYVFADDYQLKDLDSVAAFVKQNHHLPNIPSAAEIAKEGIDVAQMQTLQMEKIEELTLYLIELKKQNELLQTQNAEILKRVAVLETSNK